jgi:hypothetical protein
MNNPIEPRKSKSSVTLILANGIHPERKTIKIRK